MVTVILDEIGLGRNCFFTYFSFTFKQGLNTKSGQINHFQCILYAFATDINSRPHLKYILVTVCTNFYANKVFLATIWLDQHGWGFVLRNSTLWNEILSSATVTGSTLIRHDFPCTLYYTWISTAWRLERKRKRTVYCSINKRQGWLIDWLIWV